MDSYERNNLIIGLILWAGLIFGGYHAKQAYDSHIVKTAVEACKAGK